MAFIDGLGYGWELLVEYFFDGLSYLSVLLLRTFSATLFKVVNP